MIPCTRWTRNNPGCRCERCIRRRAELKRDKRQAKAIERVRTQDARRRAAPWEGSGRRD